VGSARVVRPLGREGTRTVRRAAARVLCGGKTAMATDSSSEESPKVVVRDNTMSGLGLEPVTLSGGKRTNIGHAAHDDGPGSNWQEWNWWVGWGKDTSCQFEGPWHHMAILAAQILSHPNTQKTTPNLYRPELAEALTPEQKESY
jgi:hypothetical protein